jgi:hypothetical protein
MKGYFVYMFLNENEDVLYIGSSIHLVTRIESQHFVGQNGNLKEECILETHKILYHQSLSESDMKVKERYLINTLVPKYNNKMNQNDRFSFVIDNINWKLYSIDNEGLIEKRNKKKEFINHFLDINSDLLIIDKSNRKNYQMFDSKNYPWHSDTFIKINNEFYFHNFNSLSSCATFKIINGVRVYGTVEHMKNTHGSDIFVWVDSTVCDDVLFRLDKVKPYKPRDESIESYNLNNRKLLFIKYDYLRRNDYLLSDSQIKKYDFILGITEKVDRDIMF